MIILSRDCKGRDSREADLFVWHTKANDELVFHSHSG